MTYERASKIFETLTESKQRQQLGTMTQLAIEYARLRVDHLIAAPDKQSQLGHHRSKIHNALIAACDALAQAMEAAHEDTLWREAIGQDRKDVGDFACYVHCIMGIESR